MIFSRDEVANIRAGRQTATLANPTAKLKPQTIRTLRRRYTPHDPDGNPQTPITETVVDHIDGDRKPVQITIQQVTTLPIDDLKQADANACGYKTLTGLKDSWRSKHPRSLEVKLVRFAVGDLRDRDRHLNWTGGVGGDYTSNPLRSIDRGEAPSVTAEVQVQITRQARERELRRRKHPDQMLRDGLMRELEQWERASGGNTDRDRAQAIRGIRRQLAVLDRKLKAA